MSKIKKRELFAGIAMHYIGHNFPQLEPEDIAKRAVDRADALLAELKNTAPTATPDTDGWITHTPGDPMPCKPNQEVDIKFRDGEPSYKSRRAKLWRWDYAGHDGDIIAWRPARP